MFEIFVVLAVVAGLWLALTLAGAVFKLLFVLVGGLFSVLGMLLALLVGGAVAVAFVPVALFALAPLWLPLLAVGVAVWVVLRTLCRPAPVEASRLPR